ncbi:hypothetical protein EDD11_004921 [Mortierella claussenii]|nr:hypothetical protein EDD11_004921 [Mortierella claussenii]
MLHSPAASLPTQPYGVIPPRRKKASISVNRTRIPSSSSSSLELSTLHRVHKPAAIAIDSAAKHESSFFTFLFADSTPSYRSNLWAAIKAQYVAYSTRKNNCSNSRKQSQLHREYASPLALRVANSAPIVTLDPTSLITSSSSAKEDVLLSLPNVEALLLGPTPAISSSSSIGDHDGAALGHYPASVASMDKFKVMRTNIIPLKTFTYCETLVEEAELSSAMTTSASTTEGSAAVVSSSNDSGVFVRRSVPLIKRSMPRPTGMILSTLTSCRSASDKTREVDDLLPLPLPLPRHLASRATRSNSAYLRMMASEMRMIRSHKLIAPLKPRGFLPRRKELFHTDKSSMCLELFIDSQECEEDDKECPLLVGSWTSVSSTESYLSTDSSDYVTAEDEDELGTEDDDIEEDEE